MGLGLIGSTDSRLCGFRVYIGSTDSRLCGFWSGLKGFGFMALGLRLQGLGSAKRRS